MNEKPLGSAITNKTPNSIVVLTSERLSTQLLSTSVAGEEFIKYYEKLRLYHYNDDLRYCTVGWGHLVNGHNSCEKLGIIEKTPITLKEAQNLFDADKAKHDAHVRAAVKVPLHQYEFDALSSLSFNVGSLKTVAPNLCRKINEGNYKSAAKELLDITNGGIPGLVKRRNAEYNMFTTGRYDSSH